MDSLNMSENIKIKNLTSFPVGFRRINGQGEVNIPPLTTIICDRAEVISQVQSGSILFCGENHDSAHAYIYIDDKDTRIYAGLETEEVAQTVISEDKVKAAFALKTNKAFEKAIDELAVTFSEKKFLVETIKKLEINDYNKIKLVEKHTGLKIEE
jgi:hypothetical protein